MPAERVSMRQIREVLPLRFASELPQRAIAKSLGLSQGAVSSYLSRARAAGVSWPLAEDLDDVQLEALLFPAPPAIAADQRPMPDWAWVHRELRRPNVTLALLWEEYRTGAPDGFGYSWFCDLYQGWAGRFALLFDPNISRERPSEVAHDASDRGKRRTDRWTVICCDEPIGPASSMRVSASASSMPALIRATGSIGSIQEG